MSQMQVATVPDRVVDSVLRDARWLSAASVVVGLLNYAYSLGMTYALPASGYSVFAAGQSVVTAAGTVAGTCGAWILAEALHRARDDAERWTAVGFSARLNLVAGFVAAASAGFVAAGFTSGATAVVIAAGAFAVFPAAVTYGFWQGDGRFRLLALGRLGETVVKVVTGGLLVAVGAGTVGASAGVLAGSVVVALTGLWVIVRTVPRAPAALAASGRGGAAAGVAAVQGGLAVLTALDQVLVAVLVDPVQAASYQTASVLSRVPLFLAAAAATAVYSAVANAAPGAAGPVHGGVSATVRHYLSAAVPFGVVLAVVPAPLVRAVLPDGYARAAGLLPWTAAAGVLLGAVVLLATVVQAAGRTAATTGVLLAGLFLLAGAVAGGQALGGVRGLAVGALLGTALVLVGLLLVAPPPLRWAFLPPARASARWGLLLLVLLVCRGWVPGWIVLAAVAGALTVLDVLGVLPTRAHRVGPRYLPRHVVRRSVRGTGHEEGGRR